LQLKALEVERDRVSRWNGQYPMYFLGGGNSGASPTGLILQMPAASAEKATAAAR